MRFESAKLLIIAFEVLLLLVVVGVLVFNDITLPTEYAPIVQLEEGKVRGIVQPVEPDGTSVYLYEGIRYGRAERFRKPYPVEAWPGVYQATRPRSTCPFNGLDIPAKRYTTDTYSEDCLYVNVWRPIKEATNRAVMVYIYGGGFNTGSIFKFTHDGRYIAARGDVILVSMNYRLGAFGFLYGGTETAPGNVGLHDQILALHWVQRNIGHFGGDPTKVTIFGNSAGSVAVSSLVLSPLSRGLFRRAILQSGSPLDNLHRNESFYATAQIAHYSDCPSRPIDVKETIDCLKSKTVPQLLNATKEAGDPCNAMYGDELLPLRPVDALNSGQFYSAIDLMFGTVKDEGPSFSTDILPELKNANLTFTIDSAKKAIVKLMNAKNVENATEVANFYTANLVNPSQSELRNVIGTSYGDLIMTCPVILFGEQFARIAPENRYYAWRLMKRAGVHVMGQCSHDWMGVCHADELFYLFSIPDQQTAEENELSQDMTRAWANFAKRGNPGSMGTVQWREAFERTRNDTVTRYMALDSANYTMVEGFYLETCDNFWRKRIFI